MFLEDSIPDCGSYEALNIVLHFSGMINAGDEMVQNTGHLSHRHLSLKMIALSNEKYALRAPKEVTPDLMRYVAPAMLLSDQSVFTTY